MVIPFNAKITGKSDIKNYADYLFEHAGPAIMSWIIEGAKRVINKNFHTTLPDVVEAAIQAYREDNDWLGQFLEECCEIAPSYRKNRVNCIRLTERIACRTANISVVPRISILRWTRLAITVFARIPECRSWD